MNDNPKRRRFQFSLRTLLVALTLVSLGFGWWAHRSKEWVRQRHEALATLRVAVHEAPNGKQVLAPGGLWVFGESGVPLLKWIAEDETGIEEIERLFPESDIVLPTVIIHQQLSDKVYRVEADTKPAE